MARGHEARLGADGPRLPVLEVWQGLVSGRWEFGERRRNGRLVLDAKRRTFKSERDAIAAALRDVGDLPVLRLDPECGSGVKVRQSKARSERIRALESLGRA